MQTKLFILLHVDKEERFEKWDEDILNLYYKATEKLYNEKGYDRIK